MKNLPSSNLNAAVWMDLSAAANLLGVHFTTLRRWADAGKVPCMRTPGGRRRFLRTELENFAAGLRSPSASAAGDAPIIPHEENASELLSQQIRQPSVQQEHWLGQLSDMQRMRFKYSGKMLMGLLMQYNGRMQGGEVFLQEAERISAEYGVTCFSAGLSISDTTRAFLFFRQSITNTIFDTSGLVGPYNPETHRLFQRTNDFFDTLFLAVLESYCQRVRQAGISASKDKKCS